jgi:hypothetical protein
VVVGGLVPVTPERAESGNMADVEMEPEQNQLDSSQLGCDRVFFEVFYIL